MEIGLQDSQDTLEHNSFAAELWGLRDGLMLCCNLNIPCLIVELE